MKYKLTKKTKYIDNHTLYQIQAVEDFSNVKKGDLGGWVESEKNLSQYDDCWISNDACVYENAVVSDNAQISGEACVLGNVQISGKAVVSDNAQIYNDVCVYGNAQVYDVARLYGYSRVRENSKVYGWAQVTHAAQISGNAQVYEKSCVCGTAQVCENAQVYGGAEVCGTAIVTKDAKVYGRVQLNHGITDFDVKENIKKLIGVSTNIGIVNDKFYAYKMVMKLNDGRLISEYDNSFEYKIGEFSEVKNTDMTWDVSCTTGIHVGPLHYWYNKKCGGQIEIDNNVIEYSYVYIMVEVDINDVITCQNGKIRCKKVKTIGICEF